MTEDENEVFEDTLRVGKVFLSCGDIPRPPDPAGGSFHPPHPHISAPSHIKPKDYDGTTDWTEYQIYFDQFAALYG